jgi:hypothetical protein
MTGWTTMNNTGLWSVYIGGAPRLNVNAAGDVTAATFAGSGPGLVNLNAANLATGTVADARLPATLPRLASPNTFTGAANRFAEVNVDSADSNPGNWTSGVLRVGGGASGEGLASNRASDAGLNRYGLDLYTGSQRRLSVTLAGDVGVGTATPAGFFHARAPAGEYYPINSMIYTGFIIAMYQGDPPHWQSFRARTEGYVPRIHLLTALPSGGGPFFGTVNVTVHEGEGTAGPVVGAGRQNVILFDPILDVAVNLDAAFPILVGHTYTVKVSLSNATNGLGWVVDSLGDMLPEGSADFPGSSRDFALAIAVQRDASDAIVVSRGGMVGINQPDPRFQLDVAGTVACWRLMTSSEFVASSARFKTRIQDFADPGPLADALRPVRYLKAPANTPEIGLIAEEVAAVLPEAVAFDDQGRPAGVSYSQIAVVALAALKEQRARTAALEARIAELERLITPRPAPR